MRLTGLTEHIRTAFEQVGYVHGIYFGDVYELWNNEQVQYVAACVTLEQVQTVGELKQYGLVIYCADKLLDDESNTTHALDYAEGAIDAALNHLQFAVDEIVDVHTDRIYTPFVQKFADTLAGYWVRAEIVVRPDVTLCDDI